MALFETRPVARRDRRAGPLIAAGIVALAWSAWNAAQSPGRPDATLDGDVDATAELDVPPV